jgi:hypothetical protein
MCDASHDDDDDDDDDDEYGGGGGGGGGGGDVVCMGADTKGGKLGPDMRCDLLVEIPNFFKDT